METRFHESPDDSATGVCNCCLSERDVRSLLEHSSSGEMYTQLLMVCYGLDVMATDIGDRKRVICSGCVRRLRAALSFRCQVEESLRTLGAVAPSLDEKTQIPYKSEESTVPEDFICAFDVNTEKTELPDKYDDCDGVESFDFDQFEDSVFTGITVKSEDLLVEVKQKNLKGDKRNRKSKSKLKRTIVKSPTADEIQAFLNAGLFPFKGTYQCVICNKKFKRLPDIRDHMPDHSQTIVIAAVRKMTRTPTNTQFEVRWSKLQCKFCPALIGSYGDLEHHVATCQEDKRLPNGTWREKLPFTLDKDQLDCPVCQQRFLNFVSLNTHMNVHYPNYICESCGKAFASQPRLKGHMRIHEVGVFPCKLCDMSFDKVTKRENHVSKQHKAGVRYSCPRCAVSLSSFYARQKHLADEHNEELKRYKCKQCPQSYITPGHLSSHVRRDHLNERNHRCDKCELAFYTRHSLTMHMIRHGGERVHRCAVCGKAYARAKTLREHARIHSNDRRFVCPACGRAFTQKCTLKSHLRVHERGAVGARGGDAV